MGKPLIAWSVIQALATNKISRVIVSTDSQEIAKIAEEFGAEIPFLRPKELSTDDATTEGVLLHALDFLKKENFKARENIHIRVINQITKHNKC